MGITQEVADAYRKVWDALAEADADLNKAYPVASAARDKARAEAKAVYDKTKDKSDKARARVIYDKARAEAKARALSIYYKSEGAAVYDEGWISWVKALAEQD